MIKLLAFDIDNTLAEINKPIPDLIINDLKAFERKGVKVAFVSGKPAIYISGMVRQVGLDNPIIIGENGLSIYYGCSVPPIKSIKENIPADAHKSLFKIKKEIELKLGPKIWFQPNEVCVTVFPMEPEIMDELQSIVHDLFKNPDFNKHLVSYKHLDSIDIAPKHINKGSAIISLLTNEGIKKNEVIAIGDGENDVSMFKEAGFAVGVNFTGDYQVDINLPSIEKAIAQIKKLVITGV
jgi:HAD superfamily hydrolase (TIGR01484 family)